MELRLTDKEEELLIEVLHEQQKHLLHEIAKADHHDFRTTLRHRCTLLEGIIEKVQSVKASV
ncbi:MAG: hypothetical protein P4M04_01245 [Acidobacteriota bacterium]|nr:hypothetical protein [Acidobacteriota bacterium]